jgi:hypothetical protein
MRISVSIVALLAVVIMTGCGNSEKKGVEGIERFIIAKSGLRMRNRPDLSGKKLMVIPYGMSVKLLEETGEAVTISGVTGRWSRVVFRKTTGWVFGGFLGSSVTDRAGKRLPAGILGTYVLIKEVQSGNMPSRVHLENSIITRTVGGDMDSNIYCIVEDVESSGKIHTVKCAPRKPTDEEYKVFQIDRAAKDLKRILVTERGKGRISFGKEIYRKQKKM